MFSVSLLEGEMSNKINKRVWLPLWNLTECKITCVFANKHFIVIPAVARLSVNVTVLSQCFLISISRVTLTNQLLINPGQRVEESKG